MDFPLELEQVKNELKALGFTEDKLNQLMDLAAEEALYQALEELKNTANDGALEELANMFENQAVDQTEAARRLNLIFEKAYGADADNKKQQLVLSYLKQTLEDTKKAKDLYDRYQAGDPTAVATIKAQEGNPDVKKVQDLM